MLLRVAGIHMDSIVDGPGFRMAVFTQGCPHNCPGCHNPQTHAYDAGKLTDTRDILAQMNEDSLLDGITLTGGEPFCQSEACAELAEGARKAGLSVWAYSGWTYEELVKMANDSNGVMKLLTHVDTLVDGPFILAQRTLELRFRGSRNQRLIDVGESLRQGRAVLSPEN